MSSLPDSSPSRVRHAFRARLLQVHGKQPMGAHFMRLTLKGDVSDFESLGFDDHFKLILPSSDGEVHMPKLVDGRPQFEGQRPAMRDYTPLMWDKVEGTLTVDVALHEQGLVSDWARTCGLGARVGVAGPRGSLVIPVTHACHTLLGDASALPAIARRLSELPQQAKAWVRIQVPDLSARRELVSAAVSDVQWVDSLVEAASDIPDWALKGYVWAAGEYTEMKTLRQVLLDKGAEPKLMRVVSYWRQGAANHEHEEM